MNRTRVLQSVAVLCLLGGGVGIWYAFQRPMCNMVAGGANECGPNVAYFVPGVLGALVGSALVVVLYLRDTEEASSTPST